MRTSLRTPDVLARFGGDEFVIVLPRTCASDAVVVAERLRQSIGSRAFRTSWGEQIKATVSVGVACSPEDGCTADELFREADRALYRAKQSGRNQIARARA